MFPVADIIFFYRPSELKLNQHVAFDLNFCEWREEKKIAVSSSKLNFDLIIASTGQSQWEMKEINR